MKNTDAIVKVVFGNLLYKTSNPMKQDSNTKLLELWQSRDFMCRETGDLASEDKIGKVRRMKVL